eukprot:TRINITY_DN520_c0_g1_i1.p2 TRINITY_DN520_c0_g1~~TRINITY_DN520_c0_g1_i1.p2  ORF type:complete len:174 (+),score=51.58 TRINITY_DN520_c0_g1_i1:219-740(+)
MVHKGLRKFVREIHRIRKWKYVRGDEVQVIAGKPKGERGKIVKVYKKKNKVLIEGVNLVKKHQKGNEESKGTIISKIAPVHYSNIQLVDPSDNRPCRIKYEFKDGKKIRVSKRTNTIIPKPTEFQVRITPKDSPKDTTSENVLKVTYVKPDYAAIFSASGRVGNNEPPKTIKV